MQYLVNRYVDLYGCSCPLTEFNNFTFALQKCVRVAVTNQDEEIR